MSTHILVELGDPLRQVGVLVQAEVVHGLLHLGQHLVEVSVRVLAGVERADLQVHLLLHLQQVIHLSYIVFVM